MYCTQNIMETVVVPSGWLSFRVFVSKGAFSVPHGNGRSFSCSGIHHCGVWRILRPCDLVRARRVAAHQRRCGLATMKGNQQAHPRRVLTRSRRQFRCLALP